MNSRTPIARRPGHVAACAAASGLLLGLLVGQGLAQTAAPSEHKGLAVEQLGVVPAESMAAQVGLDDRILLLRRITIEPGGQIARHSHESVPGVVYMESGSWIEGRDGGETEHAAGTTFVEDKDTVHWFYNHGEEPASALVCDIKPAS